MSKNIFVGSLAWGTTSEGIEQAFAQYGVVTSAKVISDRETGRSKGFAFVEMETGGDEAIKALNGSDMDGRQIVVNEARPREERSGGGGYRQDHHPGPTRARTSDDALIDGDESECVLRSLPRPAVRPSVHRGRNRRHRAHTPRCQRPADAG